MQLGPVVSPRPGVHVMTKSYAALLARALTPVARALTETSARGCRAHSPMLY